MNRVLLVSNSTNYGEGYLDHCLDAMLDTLDGRRRLAFVPFAVSAWKAYAVKARMRFEPEGVEVRGVTSDDYGVDVLQWADAVFVGGGNTFRLLTTLQGSGLLDRIHRRVSEGLVYMGASAGANIASPTICTTNDMPIVQPDSFDSLGLVSFQINPHYLDTVPDSRHMGESREERLAEYLEEHETPVVGLREGSWIRVADGSARLGGARPARIFRRGRTPEECTPGSDLAPRLR